MGEHVEPTRVAVFAPYFPPAEKGGGPIRTIAALIDNMPQGVVAGVVTRDRDLGDSRTMSVETDRWISWNERTKVRYTTPSFRSNIAAWNAVRRFNPHIVYLQSFFDPRFSIFIQLVAATRILGRPLLLLAPRGEFATGALDHKGLKKRIFITLYRLLRLHRKVVWHASSQLEEADVRRLWGENADVVVRINDIALPAEPISPRPLDDRTCLHAIHYSRCVPTKGLDILLEGLRFVSRPVELDVYGSEEDESFVRKCRRLAKSLPDHIVVRFNGHLEHSALADRVNAADFALFPTHGENFGHVIVEALSASCPVAISDTTPWSEVIRESGGFVVDTNDPTKWSECVRELSSLNQAELAERRFRAGDAYRNWLKSVRSTPHVLELVKERAHG